MPIPVEHRNRYAYHFTHIDNLPVILKHGLLSTNEQRLRGVEHLSIAATGIQGRRAVMSVTCGPQGVVHDYVPFYFCKRSKMMLSVLHKKNVDQQLLVHIAVPITFIEQGHVVFTDASANTDDPPAFYTQPDDLVRLKWSFIDSLKWSLGGDEDDQARMAEMLVHRCVPNNLISHIITWNDSVTNIVTGMYQELGIQPPSIFCDNRFHFTKYPEAPNESLVTGPVLTKRAWHESMKFVEERGQSSTARYANLWQLRDALRQSLNALPETAELIDLESANDMHSEDVGTHTRAVVRELTASREFEALNANDQLLTELAAFLHDIGKGPKSRWASKGGIQQVDPDHPIGSVKMLRRILTEEVGTMKPKSVRVLTKLVCYHDLVGDIVGKGRDAAQLEEIAESERDLDMLIALGLADMRSVNPTWARVHAQAVNELRAQVLAKLAESPEE